MNASSEPLLIQHLLRPEAYDHPVSDVRLLETHISWVILTGEFAYKLKKPLDLGFLDFSTLEKRKFFCEEELRLNGRLAPGLYLDVVPVTGSPEDPRMGGQGEALEYAVRMKQFPDDVLLDQQLGAIGPDHMKALARDIAAFHESVHEAPPDSGFGSPERVAADMGDNFVQIASRTEETDITESLQRLRAWNTASLAELEPLIRQRAKNGFVRECHGDLHLTNLVLLDDRIVPFDGIEFSETLRFVDVMSEVAFLAMDLILRKRSDLAHAFVAHYLERSGDYAGLPLLPVYMVYRSLVRAKVAAIRFAQDGDTHLRDRCRAHVLLADELSQASAPTLFLMHGVSGSGKTWLSEQLIPALPALRVRSDVERKRLFGETTGAAPPGAGVYSKEHTTKTYTRLEAAARDSLNAGFSMIVDAAFLKRAERENFHRIAEDCGARFVIIECTAPEDVLRQRVTTRTAESRDASDADVAVLDFQLEHGEGITPEERPHAITVDTSGTVDLDKALRRMAAG